jgi:hypothetical protein
VSVADELRKQDERLFAIIHELRDQNAELRSWIERVESHARAVVANWYEFGPEGSMDESVSRLYDVVNSGKAGEVDAALAEDRSLYGFSLEKVSLDGKRFRIDPKKVIFT